MTNLYEYIDKWSSKDMFKYAVIVIVILCLCSSLNVGLNIIVGLIVAYFIISYLNHKNIVNTITDDENTNIKINSIQSSLNYSDPNSNFIEQKEKFNSISNKCSTKINNVDRIGSGIGVDIDININSVADRKDIIDFIFSIQDLYAYSPLQYRETIDKIKLFFSLYDTCFIDNSLSNTYYDNMKLYKRDGLNALISMIFSIPDDQMVRAKVNNAVVVLDAILTKYLDQISYLIDNEIYKNGYNINTKIIDYGPCASNEYDDIFKPYSYEIY